MLCFSDVSTFFHSKDPFIGQCEKVLCTPLMVIPVSETRSYVCCFSVPVLFNLDTTTLCLCSFSPSNPPQDNPVFTKILLTDIESDIMIFQILLVWHTGCYYATCRYILIYVLYTVCTKLKIHVTMAVYYFPTTFYLDIIKNKYLKKSQVQNFHYQSSP